MKKIVIILSGAIMAFGCSKEDNLNTEEPQQTNFPKSVIAGDLETTEVYQYEVYDFPDNPGAHLENRLVGIFDGTQTSDIPIDEAIWLWETGANYFFTPSVPADNEVALDGEILVWDVTFSLAENNIPVQGFKDEFENSMGRLDSIINAGNNLALTDVRFKELAGSTLHLEFTVALHQEIINAPFSIATGGPFPPATKDKMLGTRRLCNSATFQGLSSWDEVEAKAKGVIPKAKFVVWKNGPLPGNILLLTSHFGSVNNNQRVMPSDWLPGENNPLFSAHADPAHQTECIFAHQNDAYSQRFIDEINGIIVKPGLRFQGWARMNMEKQPHGSTPQVNWDFKVHLAEVMTAEPALDFGLTDLEITL